MRTTIASALIPLLAAGALLPAPVTAQAGRTGTQTTSRTACAADSTRGFRRSVGETQQRAGQQQAQPRTGQTGTGTGAISGGTQRSQSYPEFDVVLDLPNVCVGKIYLKVDSLTAKLALNAQVANLLRVNAGADVLIGNVDLTVRGVQARALLLVDLDDVVHVVDQTLTFVDNHPEVVRQLTGTLQNTVGTVGGLVGGALRGLLLGTTTNALGQTVQRVVDETTGSILERTLSAAGQAAGERTVGSLLNLPTIRETVGAATNQVVRQTQDQTGAIIEYTLDRLTNRISNIRIVRR